MLVAGLAGTVGTRGGVTTADAAANGADEGVAALGGASGSEVASGLFSN